MLDGHDPLPSESAASDLRRQIDRSVSRALVDRDYQQRLLADPTVLLEGRGCPPQHFLHLRGIRAESLTDFARQAEALFWLDRRPHLQEEEQRPAAAAI
ncbi:MAG: hypothetical protein JOZ81_05565 [Chloroflexi bacterium]|nr:hypothetical protein [Chloroflexota bacterium]MBV9542863.1 hypothetical protein [Chloroflexota bacterium]